MQIKTGAEQLLYSTVRIEVDYVNGKSGAGTGFLFQVPAGEGFVSIALVTNKHVISNSSAGRIFFTEAKGGEPNTGKRVDIQIAAQFESAWYGHPDPDVDVAAMNLSPILNHLTREGITLFYRTIAPQNIPTSEQLEQLDAIEEVTFVGYPNGLYDEINLLPIFRRGHTATPLQVDYNGKPIFLIDASVFPGSSGSPVLIYNLGGYSGRGGMIIGSRMYFLGILAQGYLQEKTGQIEFRPISTNLKPVVTTQDLINLGIVFKASTVQEVVLGLQSSGKPATSVPFTTTYWP